MSMVSEALRKREIRAGGRPTVAGVVNSVETLEGEGFWSVVLSPNAGVIRSKKCERGFTRRDGRKHEFKLWLNLAKRDKMTKPRYQQITLE